MAHKWLIKAQFTAYKVHQYFTRGLLSKIYVRALCLLAKDYSPPKKKNH